MSCLVHLEKIFPEFCRKIESRNPGEKLYGLDKNENVSLERRSQSGVIFWKHRQHHWVVDWVVRDGKVED